MKRITGKQLLIHFLISNIVTQFLFFIDEGYYDFRWMKLWGNWLVYVIYVVIIWLLSLGLRWIYNAIRFLIRKSVAK